MENKISGEVTALNKTNLEGIPALVAVEMPYLLNLIMSERQSLRKMATKNTGYVADVFAGVQAHPGVLPTSFNMAEFVKDMALMGEFPYVKQIFVTIIEKIEDTEMQLGHELMKQADMGYSHLKLAAKDNAPVKTIVDEIGTAYFGAGIKKLATGFTIAAGTTITVSSVFIGTSFVNNGTTVLRFKAGGELASKYVVMDAMVVEPGNSVLIPSCWNIIEVTNQSTTAEGSFSVKIK